jgi:hypothetical protein
MDARNNPSITPQSTELSEAPHPCTVLMYYREPLRKKGVNMIILRKKGCRVEKALDLSNKIHPHMNPLKNTHYATKNTVPPDVLFQQDEYNIQFKMIAGVRYSLSDNGNIIKSYAPLEPYRKFHLTSTRHN